MYHANRMMIDHANQIAEERIRLVRERQIAESQVHRGGIRTVPARVLIAVAGWLEPGHGPRTYNRKVTT